METHSYGDIDGIVRYYFKFRKEMFEHLQILATILGTKG